MTFAVSFVLLTSVFVYTMLHHMRAIDYPYLWYALLRIALISFVTAALAILIRKRGYLAHVFFGAIIGFGLAVAYVNLALNLKS